MNADDLTAVAVAIKELGASVISTDDIGIHAIEYALHHHPVFPLNGKIPAIAGGRGVLDATTDTTIIARWWGGRYQGCNIGGRVPMPVIVIDVDPRNGGLESLATLERVHGPLPETLTTISGRGDGGAHYFYRRPPGKLSHKRLGAGIDLKTSSGYTVLAPSIHPATSKPYTRIDRPVAAPPAWLVELLLPEPAPIQAPTKTVRLTQYWGRSVADEFTANSSWHDILTPHGWRCIGADTDGDGAKWLHPTATSAWSATIRNGCLFVYSPNTPFEVTEPGNTHGYTKFRAYAVLNHDGDMSAAARTLRGVA